MAVISTRVMCSNPSNFSKKAHIHHNSIAQRFIHLFQIYKSADSIMIMNEGFRILLAVFMNLHNECH